jgi:UDP-N-acetylmuramoyl-L-alanyl-D-glutamate--2,6-diaminopimelate ligase
MQICELIYKSECISYTENLHYEVKNITTDIFKLCDNTLYIAERRRSADIQKLSQLIENKNGIYVVCDRDFKVNISEERIIRVENVRLASAHIHSRFYGIDFEKLKFIGITGTNGKSTTAILIKEILIRAGESVGLIGTGKISINERQISDIFYSMTTPDVDLLYKSIKQMQDEGCTYIVMEVSSHALYFEKCAPIKFEIGIFTNLSHEHGDFHTDMEDYFSAKLKLFKNAKVGIFNLDDEYSMRAYKEFCGEKYGIGIFTLGDAMAKDINAVSLFSSEFIYRENREIFKINMNIPGIFNVFNALFAIKTSLILKIPKELIKNALSSIAQIEGKNEIICKSPKIVIDYAHTPAAFKNELFFLKSTLIPGQKLIVVFGCGGERDREKRREIAKIVEKYADFIIVSQDNSRAESKVRIFRDILSGFENPARVKVISSRKSAIIYATALANRDDLVAIIGKGHERYNASKTGKSYFNERDVIKSELERLEKIRCE